MTEQSQVGETIRRVRRERGVSLRSFAGRLGVSPATMSALETGRTPITVPRLGRIAELLGVSVAALLHGAVAEAEVAVSAPRAGWRDYSGLELPPVLEAASAVFVRRGFHAASMREVAVEAGLSVAGVYHHFPSKEQILVALLDVTMDELHWRVTSARDEGSDPVASFALMVESLALFHVMRADLAFLGASEMRSLTGPDLARVRLRRSALQHLLDEQAERCVRLGRFDTADPRTACRAVATMCTSLPSWFRLDGPISARQVARKYAGYALALMRGDEPEAAARSAGAPA